MLWFIDVGNIYAKSGLAIPRFASIKSNKVHSRTGPNLNYPIEWEFIAKGEPVEIVAEFDLWRRIRDKDGEGGWVHKTMLSGKRSVVIIGSNLRNLYKDKSHNSKIIAKLAPDLRCVLKKAQDKWCQLDCRGQQGWILKDEVWGVYFKEEF